MPTQTTPPDAARDTEPTECFAVPGQNHIVDVIDTTGTKLFTAFPGDHAAVAIEQGRITISAEVLP